MSKRTGKYIICETCGKEKYCPGSRFKRKNKPQYCSHKCANIGKAGKGMGGVKKGNIPWNKGLKGIMKPNSTSFQKDSVPWNKGLEQSGEIKKKCGIANKGIHRSPKTEFKKGLIPWNKNKRLTENHKEKIRKTRISKPNNLEKMFDELTPDIVYYVGDWSWWRRLPNGKYKNPDFKVRGQHKVIEVFGDFWHKNDNPEKLTSLYKKTGLECLVIWENEIRNNPDQVLERVINFL